MDPQSNEGERVEYDRDAPRIEDELARIAGEIPDEEWARLPHDLCDRLDDYLYGELGR